MQWKLVTIIWRYCKRRLEGFNLDLREFLNILIPDSSG